jgi:hypothetical protein
LRAIPGVNVLSRLAEQIASTISFAAGEPSGRTLCATVRIKRLPRIAPVYLQNITPSLVLCPSPWDKTRDKTHFVPSPKMAESLAFLEVPRKPTDGFELPVPEREDLRDRRRAEQV